MTARVSMLDVRLGVRMLLKHPALTVVGGLGLAVGIAIAVGFFSMIINVAYPALPLPEGDRIVSVENRDAEVSNEERRSIHDFYEWREELESIDGLAAFRTVGRTLVTGAGGSESIEVAEMTAAGFAVARVSPVLGRYLQPEDERGDAPAVVVIGHDVWQNRFSGDPSIVGRDVRLNGTVHTVVGVMPEGFAFPASHSYWTAFRADPTSYERREGPAIYMFGRLADGATMAQAQAELSAIGAQTASAYPETHAQLRPMVMPYTHSIMDIQGVTMWQFAQMQLPMTLLLVVVAMNVAVLVYARTAMRQGEIAVRSALGASRGRVVAQLFTEALVLSLLAAAAGLALAQVGIRLGFSILAAEQEGRLPFWMGLGIRPSTVAFTVALAVLAAVIVGVVPALQATGRRLQSDLRQLGGTTGLQLGRTWTALIVAQVTFAVALLPAAAGMAWREIGKAATRPAYAAEEYVSVEIAADPESPTGSEAPAFGVRITELMGRLDAEPEVAGVSLRASLPERDGRVVVDGVAGPAAGHEVLSVGVLPGFFQLFERRILAGRDFAAVDTRDGATAVIVNRAFVRRVLAGGPALGRRLRYVDAADAAATGSWYEIVGVVEDLVANRSDPDRVAPAISYAVAPQQLEQAALAIRLRGTTPTAFAPRLRELAVSIDPSLRVWTVHSMAESNRQQQSIARLVALAVSLVLLAVFLLSAAGIYAMMSFTVTQRRREIGIRAALGAHPRQVLAGVFSRAATQIATGLVLGVSLALLLEWAMGGQLVGRYLPIILPGIAALMALTGLLAALGPARRGLAVQPTEALRGQD